jgi:[ribosomal protein S18]-alanine N-acetyltransferase
MASIRNARQDEAELLAIVGFRAWDSTSDSWSDASDIRENALRSFEAFAASNWLSIDVAERAGQIVGWAAREKLDNNITDIWVEPVFQRQGVGTRLLQHVEKEVIGLGHETVTTEVHSENTTALAFFKKADYSVSWMTTAWSSKLDRDVDTVGLRKAFFPPVGEGPYGQF